MTELDTTVTAEALRHLRFNDNGEVLCGARTHGAKVPKATVVGLRIIPPSQRSQPETGEYVTASNGKKVCIDSAFCGTHARAARNHFKHSISAAVVNDVGPGLPGLILDYAKRRYEADLAAEAAALKERREQYAAARRREYDNITFTVERQDEPGSMARWVIVGHDPEPNRRSDYPLAIITVADDSQTGRLWVNQSEYINTGPGKGSAKYIDAYRLALFWAAEFVENYQPGA